MESNMGLHPTTISRSSKVTITLSHKYVVDGKSYPGYTEIAKAAGLMRYFGGDDYYLKRGTAVHEATLALDRGELDWDNLSPDVRGFVLAYFRFKEDSGISWEHAEEPLAHSIYHYAGMPDRFLPLYDIKTTDSAFELQLAAYAELLRVNEYDPGRKGYFLHLKEDGTYKIREYRFNMRDTSTFLCAVSLFHYRKERNLL